MYYVCLDGAFFWIKYSSIYIPRGFGAVGRLREGTGLRTESSRRYFISSRYLFLIFLHILLFCSCFVLIFYILGAAAM